jgi:hypothetical protein
MEFPKVCWSYGKYIVIQAPSNGGSFFYNYKETHSVCCLQYVMPITHDAVLAKMSPMH